MLEELYQRSSLEYMSLLQNEWVLQALLPSLLNLCDDAYTLEEWQYFLVYIMRDTPQNVHSIQEAKSCLLQYTWGDIIQKKRKERYGKRSIK